jgi:chromosome segregation ATPase
MLLSTASMLALGCILNLVPLQGALQTARDRIEQLEALSNSHVLAIEEGLGTVAAREAEVAELRRMLGQQHENGARQDAEMAALREHMHDADAKAENLESQMEELQVWAID